MGLLNALKGACRCHQRLSCPQTRPCPVLQGFRAGGFSKQHPPPTTFWLPLTSRIKEPQNKPDHLCFCLSASSDMGTWAVSHRGSSSRQCVRPLPPLSYHLLDLMLWQNHVFVLSTQLEDGREFLLGAHLWVSSPPTLALQVPVLCNQLLVSDSICWNTWRGFPNHNLDWYTAQIWGGTLFFDLQLSFPMKNLEDPICSKRCSLNDP